jgi:hypothetical protein
MDSIKYVGMDLYKETILIAVRNQVALESRDCRKVSRLRDGMLLFQKTSPKSAS